MRLGFNAENGRYGVLEMDLWKDSGLHCGEHLKVWKDNRWVDDRIEMSKGEWYLVKTGYKGSELEGLKVQI